jgi:hypothetical protein
MCVSYGQRVMTTNAEKKTTNAEKKTKNAKCLSSRAA